MGGPGRLLGGGRQRPPNRSAWLTRYQAILGPLYTLFLPFAFRVEGWQFTLGHLRGPRRGAEVALMVISTIAWLAPAAVFGWWWLACSCSARVWPGCTWPW